MKIGSKWRQLGKSRVRMWGEGECQGSAEGGGRMGRVGKIEKRARRRVVGERGRMERY